MKRLGQHFLKNPEILESIAERINKAGSNIIIEVGPGHGELTEKLSGKIIAIEKDRDLAAALKQKFAANKNIEIIAGDALNILPELTANPAYKSYVLAGNIPYYITGYLLRTISGLENKPRLSVLTVQKEVAERIEARPPKMNRLAAAVQFWAEPKIIFFIKKREFYPPPEVDSALIELRAVSCGADAESYYKTVRALFKQPRKTIHNNITSALRGKAETKTIAGVLKKMGIDHANRPQNLSVEQIVEISSFFGDKI